MSRFHCSCGFAIDQAEEFGDHMHQAFARDNDMGTDGHTHRELADADQARHVCACGFATSDMTEFDDHLLIVFMTPDAVGTDGVRTPQQTLQPPTCGTCGRPPVSSQQGEAEPWEARLAPLRYPVGYQTGLSGEGEQTARDISFRVRALLFVIAPVPGSALRS